MSETPTPIALVCSDIHLKHKPPIARWGEPDWYLAMKRPLDQLRALKKEHGVEILYAGDIFDTWNPPPELINFAIKNLPTGIAIPGQHDLPYHSYEKIHCSAYWTLVQAGILHNLEPGVPAHVYSGEKNFWVHGFPWGTKLKPTDRIKKEVHIALVHKLVWDKKEPFPGAPRDSRADNLQRQLKGFDIAVFGDNHKTFCRDVGRPTIYNCGSFMRNTADQLNYWPRIGIIYDDCVIGHELLDRGADKFLAKSDWVEQPEIPELAELVEQFSKISRKSVSFLEALENLLKQDELSDDVKKIIITAMEVAKKDVK